VVSSSLKKADWHNSTILTGIIREEVAKLKEQSGGEMLITGSATLVHSLMGTDLIDEYRFLVQPIVMGSGKRFWKSEMPLTKLKLVSTKTYPKGVLGLTYQSIKQQ
jgi:dihydrofolate reductase